MSLMTAGLHVPHDDRATLELWSRSTANRAGMVSRARLVLAVADGLGRTETSRRVGVSRPTVIQWRDRSAEQGLAGLDDASRSGRAKQVDEAAILAATLDSPPDRLGVTHWSTRLLGAHLGVSD